MNKMQLIGLNEILESLRTCEPCRSIQTVETGDDYIIFAKRNFKKLEKNNPHNQPLQHAQLRSKGKYA